MPITENTRFIGIEKELTDLSPKRSKLINEKTDDYSLSDIMSAGRKSVPAVLDELQWTLVSGVYEQDIVNAFIKSTSYIAIVLSNADIAVAQAAEILPENESFDGFVRVFSKNLPLANINITLNIFI
jgi:hypothetical protein